MPQQSFIPSWIQYITMIELPSTKILSPRNTWLVQMMLAQATQSPTSGIEGSNKGEPPIANNLASEPQMTKLVPPLASLILSLKLSLTNLKGGSSQEMKRIL